jgi:hypothetical protein
MPVDFNNLMTGKSTQCGACGREETKTKKLLQAWGRIPDEADFWIQERWDAIFRRCTDPKNRNYHNYGGRGIKLHPDFYNRVTFIDYVKTLPNFSKDLQLDRRDNSRGYEPGNLRWVPQKDNVRNMRGVIQVSFKGVLLPAKEFAERYVSKFLPNTVVRLAKRGFTGEEILEKESKCKRAGVRYIRRRP